MAGTAWTLHPELLCEKLVHFWETAGLDSSLRRVRRLPTSLGTTAYYSIGTLWNRKSTAEGLHHCLDEDRSFTEHAVVTRADGGLSESLVAPSVSQANDLFLRSDMYAARKDRKQHKQTPRAQAAAGVTRQEASIEEPFISGRSSTSDDAPTPAVDGRTGHGAAPGRFSQSSSHGRSGSIKEPSSKHLHFPGAEPSKSQPGYCEEPTRSTPSEPKVSFVWPMPLLQGDSDESPESSLVNNIGVPPLFGVRNMPIVPKKGSRRRPLLHSRRSEDDLDSETEAIELDVLKWMTYESPNESLRESAPPPSLSDEGREIETEGQLKEPKCFFGQLSSTEKQSIEAITLRPTIAYDASSTERCTITQDLINPTEGQPSQVLIMGQVDDIPEEGGGIRGHVHWTTRTELGKQDSSHDATHSESDLEEKLAAWDPSQEDSYALASPGHLELFDLEVADPRSSQASQQPQHARTELAVDYCFSQRPRKAPPSATTDLCSYDDLKWIFDEPEKGEPEPAHGQRIEHLHQAGTKQRFKRKPAVRMTNATAATSVSVGVHPQPQAKAPELFNAQCVSAVPTFTASSTNEAHLTSEKPLDARSIEALQEITERFSVSSKLTSPPSLQAEEGQPKLVEPLGAAETLERGTTDAESEAKRLDNVHATKAPVTASHGLEVSVSGNGVTILGDVAPDGEDQEKMEADTTSHARLPAPRKRRKKRRKHRKRRNPQEKQLAKIRKKRREAVTSRKEVESESKKEHEGGRHDVVRPLLPRSPDEWPVELTSGWTLSGIGSALRLSGFDDDEVQLQDTGDVTIRIRTSTRSKAAMVWPFGPC